MPDIMGDVGPVSLVAAVRGVPQHSDLSSLVEICVAPSVCMAGSPTEPVALPLGPAAFLVDPAIKSVDPVVISVDRTAIQIDPTPTVGDIEAIQIDPTFDDPTATTVGQTSASVDSLVSPVELTSSPLNPSATPVTPEDIPIKLSACTINLACTVNPVGPAAMSVVPTAFVVDEVETPIDPAKCGVKPVVANEPSKSPTIKPVPSPILQLASADATFPAESQEWPKSRRTKTKVDLMKQLQKMRAPKKTESIDAPQIPEWPAAVQKMLLNESSASDDTMQVFLTSNLLDYFHNLFNSF